MVTAVTDALLCSQIARQWTHSWVNYFTAGRALVNTGIVLASHINVISVVSINLTVTHTAQHTALQQCTAVKHLNGLRSSKQELTNHSSGTCRSSQSHRVKWGQVYKWVNLKQQSGISHGVVLSRSCVLIADSVVIGSLEDYCLWTVYCYKLHTKGTLLLYLVVWNCMHSAMKRPEIVTVWRSIEQRAWSCGDVVR